MIFKFILISLLLRSNVYAQGSRGNSLETTSGARYCDFDGSRKNYDASDLLQCIDDLAADVAERESGKSQWNGSTGRQISFTDILANFLNADSASHQIGSLPSYATSSQYQSYRPVASGGPVDRPPGFQLNVFDALSSISRHDDYKCVPRILCEMASGKLPGRSLGKQRSGFFEFLGRNAFTDWLSGIDVAAASPLLNFGRAMILGYSNKGEPAACYRAFPRCPRDSSQLVYYLNNYNGGFFRLFNRFQAGGYGGDFRGQQGGSLRILSNKKIASEISKPETIPNRVYFPVLSDYEESEEDLPNYDQFRDENEVTFPDQNFFPNKLPNNIPNNMKESRDYIWEKESTAFFPEETRSKRSRIRFPQNDDTIA